MRFSDELTKWRSAKALSQSQAAREIAVNVHTLQSWEQGIRVPHEITQEGVRARMAKVKSSVAAAVVVLMIASTNLFAPDSKVMLQDGNGRPYSEVFSNLLSAPDLRFAMTVQTNDLVASYYNGKLKIMQHFTGDIIVGTNTFRIKRTLVTNVVEVVTFEKAD